MERDTKVALIGTAVIALCAVILLAGCEFNPFAIDVKQDQGQNQSQGPTPTPTPTPILSEGSDCSAGTLGICGPGLACAIVADGTRRCLPAPTPTPSPR